MDRSDLHGFVPAIVTPFTEGGEIDEEAFVALVGWLICNGATALCVSGDNGEAWTLSARERGRLTRLAVDAAGGRAPIILGASAPTIQAALDYAAAGAENGASALLAMPPTYVLKGSHDEILRRFAQLGEAQDLPLVIYNSPRRAGYSIPLETIGAALDAAPVIGIKESNRDVFRLSHLLDRFAERMQVMVGPSHLILPGLALGAAGFISTGPELLGPRAGRIVEIARATPGEDYRLLHRQLVGLYELLMATGTWPSSLKAALTAIGQPAGTTRDPVLPLDPAARAELVDALSALGCETRAA